MTAPRDEELERCLAKLLANKRRLFVASPS